MNHFTVFINWQTSQIIDCDVHLENDKKNTPSVFFIGFIFCFQDQLDNILPVLPSFNVFIFKFQ